MYCTISELFLHLNTDAELRGKAAHKAGRQAGALVFDECLYLPALGVLFFIAGPTAMLGRAWASHVRSCKAPQSSEMVTNPGLLSGGESGRYEHSRKVTPVRGGGEKKPEKEVSLAVASS